MIERKEGLPFRLKRKGERRFSYSVEFHGGGTEEFANVLDRRGIGQVVGEDAVRNTDARYCMLKKYGSVKRRFLINQCVAWSTAFRST